LDYRNEYIVALHNDTTETKTIQAGERIAQLILLPYQDIDFIEVANPKRKQRFIRIILVK